LDKERGAPVPAEGALNIRNLFLRFIAISLSKDFIQDNFK
jgi:hypothetical protein